MNFWFPLAAAIIVAGIAVAGIAAVVASTTLIAAAVVAVVLAGDAPSSVMYPDDDYGDDHDYPKGLIIREKSTGETSVITVVTTHENLPP